MKRTTKIAFVLSLWGLTTVGTTSVSREAEAFPQIDYWHMPASGTAGQNRAGAEGLYGTGGPHDYGLQCANCHIEAAGLIDLVFTPNPGWQTAGANAAYEPTRTYDIQVVMTGEHLGGAAMDNS